MRSNLTKEISSDEFLSFYWLKKELQEFCKMHSISSVGSKEELSERIVIFLNSGIIQKTTVRLRKKSMGTQHEVLTLDTVIEEQHRCNQKVREFFKSVIGPQFHFSTYIQNYFKNNVGKTYNDTVTAWYEEEEGKKDKSYKTKIAPQFEYNQFIRDYFEDPANKGKKREEAINAWKRLKSLPGPNKYIFQ